MRQGRNQSSEYLPQRRKGRKGDGLSFRQEEKSFLDRAHSLGMTWLGVSLGDFAP